MFEGKSPAHRWPGAEVIARSARTGLCRRQAWFRRPVWVVAEKCVGRRLGRRSGALVPARSAMGWPDAAGGSGERRAGRSKA
ncbi:hypothetical protein GLA29479_2445 [Lysobacter antibioticus]|nr:hypothetical protein GLA29479_2445 [Lysobacter antibioticus]